MLAAHKYRTVPQEPASPSSRDLVEPMDLEPNKILIEPIEAFLSECYQAIIPGAVQQVNGICSHPQSGAIIYPEELIREIRANGGPEQLPLSQDASTLLTELMANLPEEVIDFFKKQGKVLKDLENLFVYFSKDNFHNLVSLNNLQKKKILILIDIKHHSSESVPLTSEPTPFVAALQDLYNCIESLIMASVYRSMNSGMFLIDNPLIYEFSYKLAQDFETSGPDLSLADLEKMEEDEEMESQKGKIFAFQDGEEISNAEAKFLRNILKEIYNIKGIEAIFGGSYHQDKTVSTLNNEEIKDLFKQICRQYKQVNDLWIILKKVFKTENINAIGEHDRVALDIIFALMSKSAYEQPESQGNMLVRVILLYMMKSYHSDLDTLELYDENSFIEDSFHDYITSAFKKALSFDCAVKTITNHSPTKHSPTKHSPTKHSPTKHSPTKHSPTKHSPTNYKPMLLFEKLFSTILGRDLILPTAKDYILHFKGMLSVAFGKTPPHFAAAVDAGFTIFPSYKKIAKEEGGLGEGASARRVLHFGE